MERVSLRRATDHLVDRAVRGPELFVDTGFGGDGRDGKSWKGALDTIQETIARLAAMHAKTPGSASHAIINVLGDLRGAVSCPVGVYGVKIRGGFHGRPRHTTASGVYLTGNGAAWREAATAENLPLVKLREHGWQFENLLMIPESGYAAWQLRCAEDATDPDASHAKFVGCEVISPGSQVGFAFEDVGGAAHIGVYDCRFRLLEYGWKQTSVGIRSPQWHEWHDNVFTNCKNDITMNALACEFRRNRHRTVYNGTTHPNTLNLAFTSDAGVAATPNTVVDCEFRDNAADVTIAKGYKPATGDMWRNRVANTAADIVAVPA